jgi:hypothetical protein
VLMEWRPWHHGTASQMSLAKITTHNGRLKRLPHRSARARRSWADA